MPLAPELLETIVCPKSKKPLIYFEAEGRLVCVASRLAYRVDHNVPVLLVEEATELSAAEIERLVTQARAQGLPNT
jgi:uncharacterized protein YbaR (Trm112 family)